MKKITVIVMCLGFMLMGRVGAADAYTEVINLNHALINNQSFTWQHSTPADFEVPYDIVNGATLSIEAFSADGPNGVVVQGTMVGSLSGGWWDWSTDTFNIKDIFVSWANGGVLNVTVDTLDNFLFLANSTLTLDYTNGYPPNGDTPPVPEPATMLLLGAGLAGMGFWGKRGKTTAAV
jgi:hypothetical protein